MNWMTLQTWSFNSPGMLIALFSLLVPIIIHLLSNSKGRLIPFGNIKLIKAGKPIRMLQIRLVERLLLLCRLSLLFISVLILAQFYLEENLEEANANEGYHLVTQDWLLNSDDEERLLLASKSRLGNVYLLSNFPEMLSSEQILAWDSNQHKLGHAQQNTWLLIKNTLKQLPEQSKSTIYSTNRLSQFMGDKVSLPSTLAWKIKQVDKHIIDEKKEVITETPLTLLIISGKNQDKLIMRLQAALSIIKNTKLHNLSFSVINTSQLSAIEESPKVSWILYLSEEPIPQTLIEAAQQRSNVIGNIHHSNTPHINHSVNWKEISKKIEFPQMLTSMLLDTELKQYAGEQQLTNDQIQDELNPSSTNNLMPLNAVMRNEKLATPQFLIFLLVMFWSLERVFSEISLNRKSKGVIKHSISSNIHQVKRN